MGGSAASDSWREQSSAGSRPSSVIIFVCRIDCRTGPSDSRFPGNQELEEGLHCNQEAHEYKKKGEADCCRDWSKNGGHCAWNLEPLQPVTLIHFQASLQSESRARTMDTRPEFQHRFPGRAHHGALYE
ncbi:uncharacterized protein LOC112351140 [Selaginella moellendorffii]|uniref:uncharacterized protein LOC112351140 n=1 Tax=Selaginella moellendorffii TaxID=88036 RepID=UPI000D1D0497|nr:uncharacterized protein LOC112351140 [Selaginella moellendorffii]|eukprot:XP_024544236.1 uncharacterized protein LOC112351140 [Selaginella moellendorffii]